MTKHLLLLTICILLFISILTQVTIGSGVLLEKAALLEIKDKKAATYGDVTSTTGWLMSDVSNTNLSQRALTKELLPTPEEPTNTIVSPSAIDSRN